MSAPRPAWEDGEARALVEQARRVEIEVPPHAQARVGQALRKRSQARRLAWPMFFAGAGAAVLAAVLLLRPRPTPFATQLVGRAGPIALRAGEPLRTVTEPSVVELGTVGRLVAGRDTVATVDRVDEGGVHVRLERGSLLAHVTPRSARAPFLIRTPRFTARVVGTVLRVVVHPDGRSSLAVGHGAVEVRPDGGAPVLVRAGERWPADARDELGEGELERLGEGVEGVSAASFAPPPTSCEGEPYDAIRCYLRLAEVADPSRAETALYEAGLIAWREFKDGRRALAIWQRQRERFPDGLLRSEVRTSIIDALVVLRRPVEAAAEIEAFLRDEPSALRAIELCFVLGTLYREIDGGCARARIELDQVARTRAQPWSSRARAFAAGCRDGIPVEE